MSQTADAEEYLVLDENGKVVLSTTQSHEGASVAHESYFVQASQGITAVQPVGNSKLAGHQTITISTPLFDQNGQEIGELAANLNLERLDGIVAPVDRARVVGPDVPGRARQPFVGQRLRTGRYAGVVHSRAIDLGLKRQATVTRSTPTTAACR